MLFRLHGLILINMIVDYMKDKYGSGHVQASILEEREGLKILIFC